MTENQNVCNNLLAFSCLMLNFQYAKYKTDTLQALCFALINISSNGIIQLFHQKIELHEEMHKIIKKYSILFCIFEYSMFY